MIETKINLLWNLEKDIDDQKAALDTIEAVLDYYKKDNTLSYTVTTKQVSISGKEVK